MLTILECVQAACNELGLTAPASVYTAADLQTIQLGALMNADLRELRNMNEKGWTDLQKSFVITIGPAVTTTGTYAAGATIITGIPSTAAITPATSWQVSGAEINQAARVVSVDSATQITIDIPTSGAATAADLVFTRDTYAMPDDFDHFINDTWWDVTNHWILFGPDSPQRYQQEIAGIVTTGPRRHFRILGRNTGNVYRIWPPIGTVENNFSIEWQYISKFAVQAVAGTYKERFTADDDKPTLEDNIFILGAKWRFFQVKQLDFAPMQAEYLDYVNRRIAQDGGSTVLNLARGSVDSYLISPAQVPDGNWPGS